jgi:predicted transcriptional regulator
MAARKPLKVMLDEEVVEALQRLADRFGRRTGNVVAEEVITEYLEFWSAAEKVKQQEKERQRALLLGEAAPKRRAG